MLSEDRLLELLQLIEDSEETGVDVDEGLVKLSEDEKRRLDGYIRELQEEQEQKIGNSLDNTNA